MANIEDKILGIKLHNYCSSSDEASNSDDDSAYINLKPQPYQFTGSSQQTGPKGVLEDFKDFKRYTKEQKARKDKELTNSIKDAAFTTLSVNEERELNGRLHELEKRVEDEMDEQDKEFFEKYREKKMKELFSNLAKMPSFGTVIPLYNGDDYINTIDSENPLSIVIIFIYNKDNSLCQYIMSLLDTLAKLYLSVKFCTISANTPGISQNFSNQGVPAILVYKNGELIGNYVRVQDYLKRNFGLNDLEQFLKERNIIASAVR